ncbi:TPA: hypothetical protein ACXE0Z_001034 [Enterobacter cloacae]
MAWEKIFDGIVMDDHITVEWDVDDEDESEYPVKVKVTDRNTEDEIFPIVDQGSLIIPPPPNDPAKRYTYEYDSIDDMYNNISTDTGRSSKFADELEKAIQNYLP